MASPCRKTVLVTGCTPGGIGFAVATEFEARGFHVIATVRNSDLFPQLIEKGLTAVQLDVCDATSISKCRKEVGGLVSGKLDILVNNAGRGLVTPATDMSLQEVRDVYETNVFGPMAMIKTFIDLLIPTRGLIINVASLSALVPYVFGSAYSSSKAALIQYSRTIRQELRPFGVRVQVIMAGAVKSNMGLSVKGSLPQESLYQRVRHLYLRKRGYSQRESSNPVHADQFARKLVDSAVKPEVAPFCRQWMGRPDWLYYGGWSRLLYWGSYLGEWVYDYGAWRTFGLYELETLVKRDQETVSSPAEPLLGEGGALAPSFGKGCVRGRP